MSEQLFNEKLLEQKIAEVVKRELAEFQTANTEPLVDARAAAAHIGVKEHTLRSWASTGYLKIPVNRFGKSVRFKLSELEQWAKARRKAA